MSKIMVVDDSVFVRKKCREILLKEGYEVFDYDSARKSLDQLEQVSPDVILMDIVMPDIDGYQATSIIKKEKHPEIPVIMVTSKADKEDLIKGFDCGADDYIVKPFLEEELKARVKAMLRTKKFHDELISKNEELKKTNIELSAAREELAEKEKLALIGQLMVSLHHEIRNPLTAIVTNSQILTTHFDLGEDANQFMSDIEEQSVKIKNVLDKVKGMDTINVVDYVDGTTMLDLGVENNDL